MEEFVENFGKFRDYLHDLTALTPGDAELLKKIRDKFDSLGLNDVF